MKLKAFLALGIVFAMLLSGCGADKTASAGSDPSAYVAQTAETVNPVAAAAEAESSDMFTDRDLSADYDQNTSTMIQLNGDSISCDSAAVRIDGSTATITDEGTYILTGTLNDGTIVVDAGEAHKPQLVLDGVSITSETSAAICALEADKVVITLAEGSGNTLSNGGVFTANDDSGIDAVVFSKADLSFNGSGKLSVVSPAGHGIVCKDDLVFAGGTYNISSASHGIDANDSVRMTDTELTIVSGQDGIHAENTDDTSLGFIYLANGSFQIESVGDGISAGAYLQIEGGEFGIVACGGSANAALKSPDARNNFGGLGGMGGGMGGQMPRGQEPGSTTNEVPSGTRPSESIPAVPATAAAVEAEDTGGSAKGLKAAGSLVVNGGSFTVNAADDAIHSNASITVNGGSFELSSGDDGFHADETVAVTAGTIIIYESYEGIEGLHVAVSGGDISLIASDDGLNAAGGIDQSGFNGVRGDERFGGGMASSSGGSIAISGGNIVINANGDGLDANGTLEISGGTVTVSCPTSGDTAVLDYDTGGVITGGIFIGTGAEQMAQTFSGSEQGVIAVSTGIQQATTMITLRDSAGNVLISHEADQSFAIVILSSPDIVKGEAYTLDIGSSSGTFTAN